MRKLMRKWSEKRFCIVWELVMVELEVGVVVEEEEEVVMLVPGMF